MASITAAAHLYALYQTCELSPLVERLEILLYDVDVLKVRVYLTAPDTFINVFYNLAAEKVAFTLVSHGQRVYGCDNAKMGWHRHPWQDPAQHIPCAPVSWETFLLDVETHFTP